MAIGVWIVRAGQLLLTTGMLVCALAPAVLAQDAHHPGSHMRALLIGVSTYDHLPEHRQLTGPANDVVLIRDTLLARGFSEEDIAVLAEEDAAARPTRGAILDELDRLTTEAASGDMDLVFLYFSGHGSQQPNNDPDADPELDGLDEIFLPADVKGWVDTPGLVENAIVDDEIGARIAALRRSGAFVWLVVDSCHSGTLYRGPATEEVDRNVRPEELGIPDKAIVASEATASRATDQKDRFEGQAELQPGAGGFVGFYAAQTSQLAPELALPIGGTERRQRGLLSFTLAGILQKYQGITYRQAAQQILQDYLALGRAAPTPLFEGSDEDMSRFTFGDPASAPQQWPVEVDGTAWRIDAGRLHRLSKDTILALVPAPAADSKTSVLGYVRIAQAGETQSTLEPLAYQNKPAPSSIDSRAWARVVDARFAIDLVVARPTWPQQLSLREQFAWQELERLRDSGIKDATGRDVVQLVWVDPADAADVRLMVRDLEEPLGEANPDDRLWLLPPSGELARGGAGQSPAVRIPDSWDEKARQDFRQSLIENFTALARVKALFEIASQLSTNDLRDAIEIKPTISRLNGAHSQLMELTDKATLYDGDRIRIEAKNLDTRTIDLTILFVDNYRNVACVSPSLPGKSNRLEHAQSIPPLNATVNTSSVGDEHLLFITSLALPQTERADFCFLAQNGLEVLRGGPELGLPEGGVSIFELLRRAGASEESLRGVSFGTPIDLVAMHSFSWRTALRP